MDTLLSSDIPPDPTAESRKDDHIRINLEEDVSFEKLTTGLEHYFFMHEALPEIDIDAIDTSLDLFGKQLKTPLLISSMTGGTTAATNINRILAEAAQEVGMAMGLGSQRAAITNGQLVETYKVRDVAPDILLFANVGVVQLNYGFGLKEMQQAVDMAQADALILHFNPLQEAVQPEGDGNFANLLPKIEALCQALPVPVIAKEVGWGFSTATATRLIDAGIAAIDVAGAGGTSWSQVEMYRATTRRHARVAATFRDWGIPTAYAIQYCRAASESLPIFASGGLETGLDLAKCIALGANLGGMAGQFLRSGMHEGIEGVVELAKTVTTELRVAMFCVGAQNLSALAETPLHSKFI